MNTITGDLISLFNFLLPGFITSFLFYSLTSFPKKSEFEAVVIALIYTVIIKAIVEGLAVLGVIDERSELSKIICAILSALFIGIVWAFLYNNDIIHKLLRKIKVTQKSSYPSEWYGAFVETKTYIILHLKDQRRILGWPAQRPNHPDKGHFVLENAEWLSVDESGGTKSIPLKGVDKILINANNVDMVEFVKTDKTLGCTHNER